MRLNISEILRSSLKFTDSENSYSLFILDYFRYIHTKKKKTLAEMILWHVTLLLTITFSRFIQYYQKIN